jgi:hypothetical protein
MSITFKLRDGVITIPKKELESCLMIDWYIGKLINNLIDTDQKDVFEIWEDKDVFITIIDSVRFNKLILNKNYSINLDYIYSLSEKWCVPENIMEEIKQKINDKNIIQSYLNVNIQRCVVCYLGFNVNENYMNSCIKHTGTYYSSINQYTCCGENYGESKGCNAAYHVHKIDILTLKEIANVYKLIN